MVRELSMPDTADALLLLRERPIANVFLEHLILAGALGRAPGFFGWEREGRLEAVMLIGPLGGTSLEVRDERAFAPLAERASGFQIAPRHIVGHEDVTVPFWRAFEPYAAPVRWTRREVVYVVRAGEPGACDDPSFEPARPSDLEQIIENSSLQHVEDLKDDRARVDPSGFRRRHELDVRERRWWVTRVKGRVVFQVHVGPDSNDAVQVGGVFTVPEQRGQGLARAGMAALTRRLLDSHSAVSLFCAEDNAAARRVYEQVGFKPIFRYQSWLLETGA